MDGDPTVENELDGFSLFLPLPYRVAIIIVLGVWAWGANLNYLHLVKINVPALIRYPERTSTVYISHHLSTYRLATLLSVPLAGSLLFFWLITRGNKEAVLSWSILPNAYLLFLVALLVLPLKRLYGYSLASSGRARLLSTLKRISIGGIAESQDGKFGDILLADALTSYAKVFGDLFVSLCMLVNRTGSTSRPDRNCGGTYIVPFIIAVPSMIRLRQCLIEYGRVQKASAKGSGTSGGAGDAGRNHLLNALKYASAFPVILLSAIQRNYEPGKTKIDGLDLYFFWILAVTINSIYSFYWDVAKDWDLTMFSSMRDNPSEYPFGLRRHRYFYSANIYYSAIVIDFLLRFAWSIKLSPHLDHLNELEGVIFLLEFVEVFRRWLWVYLRIETEWVRNTRGPAPDDILLASFANVPNDDDSDGA